MRWSFFKLLKNKSNTYRLYLHAFIIAIPMIIIFGVLQYQISRGVLESAVADIYSQRLSNISYGVDEYFKKVSLISSDIEAMGLEEYEDDRVPNALQYSSLVRVAQSFSAKNSGMSILFYTPASNKICSELGTHSAEFYFTDILHCDDESGFTFGEFENNNKGKMYPQAEYSSKFTKMKSRYIVWLTDKNLLKNTRVVLLIDTGFFNSSYGGNFAMFDNDGKNLYAGSTLFKNADIKNGTKGPVGVNLDGTSYMCLVTNSTVHNWHYVAYIPKSQFNHRLSLLLYFFVAFILLFSIIWFVYSLVMTNRIYKPIKDFKTKVIEVPQFEDTRNDFDDIYRLIEKTGTSHNELRKMYKLLVEKYHIAVLKNVMNIEESIGYGDMLLEDMLLHNYIIIDSFVGCAGMVSEVKNNGYGDIHTGICNFISEAYDGQVDIVMNIEADNSERIFVLTVPSMDFSINDFVLHLGEYLNKAVKYPFFAKIVVNDIYETESEIKTAYQNLKELSEYQSVQIDNQVICQKDKNIPVAESGAELINRVISELNNRKFRDIKSALQEVLNIASDNKMTKKDVRKCFSDIFEKFAREIHLFDGQFSDEGFVIRAKLSYARTIDDFNDIANSICNIYDEYCFSSVDGNNSDSIVEKMKAYVNENYSDHNLSLVMLADEVDRSPVYLSRLFKKKTGIRFTDYVKQRRLKEAENLLIEKGNEYTVSMIAEKVGYVDVNHFIKTFKAEFGKTPGQVKTQIGNSKS